jgi:hypothetical protein
MEKVLMPDVAAKPLPPWASGPGEILQHGVNLLEKDSDTNRRLAMLSIDNAVELMIKTYLGLPKRATGLQINRTEFAEISESFPKLLDALEKYSANILDGINLAEIEWYHRLRNELYHQGNGLTVDRDKVVVYAELAQLLFERLFGFSLQIKKAGQEELIGEFIRNWAELESRLIQMATNEGMYKPSSSSPYWNTHLMLEVTDRIVGDPDIRQNLNELMRLRNKVVHGMTESLRASDIVKLRNVIKILSERVPSP